MPSYILSEPYKQRVDNALATVEGMPSQQKTTLIPTRFETLPQPGTGNPLRLAAYPRDIEWNKGGTVEVTIYTQAGSDYGPVMTTLPDGSQTPLTASATNVSNDFGIPNAYGTSEDIGPTPTMTWCIVGKPARGDQFVAIEGPINPVRLATITSEQMGESWAKGTAKTVEITATGQTVEVYSILDAHTKLDFQNGLAFAKSVDPTDPLKTAHVVISPPAVPLHEARFSEGNVDEEWRRGATKSLIVSRDDGEEVEVDVQNKFFDAFSPGTASLAIGRFGTTFSVIVGPQSAGEVTPGTLVTPIAPGEKWAAGSLRGVLVTGTTTEVDVLNPFDDLTELEGHRGVLFAKSNKDPLGGEETVNILISPAPKELWEARFSGGNVDEEWVAGADKNLLIPPGDGRSGEALVAVKNKFFGNFKPGTAAMAIGRVGDEFCVLTRPDAGERESDLLLANREDEDQWPLGSERQVQVHGETRTINAINLAGDYEEFDAKSQPQGPNLLAVRGSGLGAAGGTQWYIVAPPPLRFDTGTWDGEWSSGSEKAFYLDSVGKSVQATNVLFDLPGGAKGAVAKIEDQWKLVSVELETFTGTLVETVEERPYASSVYDATVVTDVEVVGEIKQSAASPVDVSVSVATSQYSVVTSMTVDAELLPGSNAEPILVDLTVTTSAVSVLDSVSVTASFDTDTCSVTVGATPTRKDITVVTGVQGSATLDLSKLDLQVAATAQSSLITVVTGVLVEHSFDVSKLYVELNKTATTAQIKAVGGTSLGKFAGATQSATFIRFPGTVQ